MLPLLAIAQIPEAIILIKGKVFQHMGSSLREAESISLSFSEISSCKTDARGNFEIKIPYTEDDVHIEVQQKGFQIVNPPEGTLLVSGMPVRDTTLQVQILILQEGVEIDLEALQNIKQKVKNLEAENRFSKRQLTKMQQMLTDTLLHYQRLQMKDQRRLSELDQNLSAAKGELDASKKAYAEEIKQRDDSLENMLNKLIGALEERYLLQREHYDQITSNLDTYIGTIKDLRDQLKIIEMVFKQDQSSSDFREILMAYNKIYEKVNTERESHIEAVGHYWENTLLKKSLRDLYSMILDKIHAKSVYQPLNASLIPLIQEAGTGRKSKIKKAESSAQKIIDDLNILLPKLENKKEKFVQNLSIF